MTYAAWAARDAARDTACAAWDAAGDADCADCADCAAWDAAWAAQTTAFARALPNPFGAHSSKAVAP